MLGLAHETPSRLLRRIKDAEFDEMPTLPSPPGSSNTSRASDDSGMSNVPRRRRMPARGAAAASPLGDDSTRLKQGGSAGRRILSPLNANNKTNNVVSRDDSVDIDSPKSRPYISRKEATDNAKPKTSLTPPNNTQPQDTRLSSLATNTVVSKASSARTARPNARSPNTPLQRVNAGTAARTQEIVYSDESETTHSEDIQHSSVVEDVNNASLSGYQDPNSSVLNAQSLDKLDSSSFMQDLQNQQDASIEYETSEAGDDVSDTPVPRNIARFRPPSPILEENEDGSGHDEAPTSHFPLASGSEQAATSTSSVDGHTSTAGTDDEQLASAEKRIAMHVVMRRRANPVNRRPSQRVQVSPETPAQHVLSLHSSHGDVEEFSQSAYSSPGVGRRLPPSAEGKPPGRQSDHTPVRYVSPGSRTVSTSTAGTANSAPAARYASPSNFETPRPAVADSDLERRKSHLLSTLRLTALRSTMKPKFKRGTPHPLRNVQNRERSETPVESENISSEGQAKSIDAGQSREDHAEAYSEDQTTTMSQSSASSHDLTTYPRGNNGNMSLPLAGTGLDTAATRFNGAKLTTYLHALNTHLSEENQNLVKTLEQTAKEVQRLMRKNQELSSASGSTTTSYVGADGDEHDAGDTTSDRLQQHQRTSDDLAQLSQHLTGSVGGSNSHSRRMQELEQELEDHRAQLQQKDTVIDQLRKQVLQEQERDEDDTGTVTIAELQKQVFTLTDQMTQATADLAAQQAEAARLRVENIDAAGRHATAIAALQGRADELLDALEDREVALEEIENRLARTQDDHVESMKTLEDELTNVLTEQDEKVRAMEERSHQIEAESKVLREAKSSADARIAALEEQINRLQASTQKQANTDVEDSQTRELGILHERIASLQRSQTRRDAALKEKDDIIQANTRIQAATVDEHTQLIDDLRSQLKDALHVNQKNTDAMSADEQKLLEVQADLQDTEKEIQDLENQLEDAQLTISRLRQQNADSAMAMDSELRKQLRAAESEIGDLRNQLAAPYRNAEPNGAGNVSSQDLRIRTLEANNHELKSRVAQLRRQEAVNTMLTPARCTPDKSVRFDSVKSMRTPRSASDILGGVSRPTIGVHRYADIREPHRRHPSSTALTAM